MLNGGQPARDFVDQRNLLAGRGVDQQVAVQPHFDAAQSTVGQLRQLNQLLQFVEPPAAEDADVDIGLRGQIGQQLARLRRELGLPGMLDNRCQRPIVIEQQHEFLAGVVSGEQGHQDIG